ncbi:MAG: 2-C-methyl-D-erythritol 4-phosphate cytidylyltransferase [Salibacteraceae bacterium]
MIRKTIIVVAGGKGSRMNSETPKQFLTLANVPVIVHTINRFISFDPLIKIVLVLPEEHVHVWEEISIEYKISHIVDVVVGGETRYQSVQNGMKVIESTDVVGVHDGVRPLVSNETIERCFQIAYESGNAIPSLPVEETLRKTNGEDSNWVNRDEYRTIQTPQCFRYKVLKNAYNQPFEASFTDDASVVENLGVSIKLVDGNRENLKITRPEDLLLAELLINSENG